MGWSQLPFFFCYYYSPPTRLWRKIYGWCDGDSFCPSFFWSLLLYICATHNAPLFFTRHTFATLVFGFAFLLICSFLLASYLLFLLFLRWRLITDEMGAHCSKDLKMGAVCIYYVILRVGWCPFFFAEGIGGMKRWESWRDEGVEGEEGRKGRKRGAR